MAAGRHLEFLITNIFYFIVAGITKYDVFSSEFDFQYLRLYTANAKIQHGGEPPS